MYLKNKQKIFLLFCILATILTSCVSIIEDPSKKYNDEFLNKNSLKIKRQKQKHLKIARENDIYYSDDKINLVDSKYYNAMRGTSQKKNYKGKIKIENGNETKNDIKYLNEQLSIYYSNRRLKDKDDNFIECEYDCSENIAYLENNHNSYSKNRISFDDIQLTEEQLYGNLTLRKDKQYNQIDAITLQKEFDYIDVMNRIKNELYLKEKEKMSKNTQKYNKTIDNVKNKFLKLFKK